MARNRQHRLVERILERTIAVTLAWSCPGSVDGSRLGIQAASWVDDVRRS